MPDYLAYLREHPDEVEHLVKDLLISVTSFFRDPEALQVLEMQVIAPMVQAKDADAPLRVWIPGCATGEEPYSIAMLLLEQLTAAQKSCNLQIFASDIGEDALEIARQGVYPESIVADVSPKRLGRFFTRVDDQSYQVTKQLREAVVFATQNLVSDAPFSKLDLISCRNLLIYLEAEVQKKVIALLHFALNEGGYLFLGPSEAIGQHVDLFEPVSKKWRVYRRIGPSRRDRVEFPIVVSGEQRGAGKRLTDPAGARPINFAELTQRVLLEKYAPAAVLINRTYEILYFHGPTTRYLHQPTGEPTQDLIRMAPEGSRQRCRSQARRRLLPGEGDCQARARAETRRWAAVGHSSGRTRAGADPTQWRRGRRRGAAGTATRTRAEGHPRRPSKHDRGNGELQRGAESLQRRSDVHE
jgi:two-component system CheB/CheR fusion protein